MGNEKTTAFLTPSPVPCLHPDKRKVHSCKVRASVIDDGKGQDKNNQEDDKFSDRRKELEKMYQAEMKPAKGRNGQCTCIWCQGTKERRCSWCNGKGVRYEIVAKSWEELSNDLKELQSGEAQFMKPPEKLPVTCSACSGSKKLRCAYCRGSGIGSYGHAY